MSATFDSASQVRCHIKNTDSRLLNLSLSFSPIRAFDAAKSVTVSIFLDAANITNAKFKNNAAGLVLTLDAKSITSAKNCAEFFKNIDSLGVDCKCALQRKNKMIVNFGSNAKIRPSDSLVFMVSSLRRNGVTKYRLQEQTIVVNGPDKSFPPKAKLSTTSKIGMYSGKFR